MRRAGGGAIFTLAVVVVVFLSADGGGPELLLRIPKAPGLTAASLGRLPIEVRQDLRSCLLAVVDRRDLGLLRRRGLRPSVVTPDIAGRELFLVPFDGPDDLAGLRIIGRAVPVEPTTAVFWTDDERSPSEVLPAGRPRKALSPRPVAYSLGLAEAIRGAFPVRSLDPIVETIVAQVSTAFLGSSIQSLQDFQTRYASTAPCEAAGDYLFSALSALGLDVRFEPFTFAGGLTSRNVVAERLGRTSPEEIVVICAHYDSISPPATRQTLAPGADDNASGTAAVLEAARVLSARDFDFTLRFVAFSAEEWGLYGSRAHAASAEARGDRIIGAINLDMIAYADAMPEDLQIIVNPASEWLGERFIQAAGYGPLAATRTVDASFVYSDHSPFWDEGYAASLAIEDDPLRNPYYHQTTDTLDKLNMEFFTGAARASVGLAAELAQPVREGYPRTPKGLSLSVAVYSSLFSVLRVANLTWSPQPDATGFNVYRTTTPHLGYVKRNARPVASTSFLDSGLDAGTNYFYVVTAVGAGGLESNWSQEVAVTCEVSGAAVASPVSPVLGFFGGRR